jgi:hypothetical protein
MELTESVDWIYKPLVSYFVSARSSAANIQTLGEFMGTIGSEFEDAVFCMPKEALHITVLDWISPVKGYGSVSKKALFTSMQLEYDHAMLQALRSVSPITVHFNAVKVSPTTIYIVGEDNGEFNSLRQRFMKQVILPPDTARPPGIIHSSLARFTRPIAIKPVKDFIAHHQLDFYETFTHLDLLHSTREPTLEVEVLKRYPL